MKIRILVNFNGRVSGHSIPFRAGQIVEVNDEDGDHFVRGHYAELLTPAVKVIEKPKHAKGVKVK